MHPLTITSNPCPLTHVLYGTAWSFIVSLTSEGEIAFRAGPRFLGSALCRLSASCVPVTIRVFSTVNVGVPHLRVPVRVSFWRPTIGPEIRVIFGAPGGTLS